MTDSGTVSNCVAPFPYPGGKGRQSDWILDRMPPHDTFVDVFGGSGAIIYNKQPSKWEVYNDVNDDLVQFYRILRQRTDELIEWVTRVPYARSVYDRFASDFFDGYRPGDPVERAGRFFVLRYMQFSGEIAMRNGFKVRAKRSPARTFDNARRDLEELADRFSDVVIENSDFQRILQSYDDTDVDVLFYCDPPYLGGEKYYQGEFDHERLVSTLSEVDSEWMVSYSTLPPGLEELGYVSVRNRRHRMCRKASDSTEHLVTSFDPDTSPKFLGEETQQQRLEVLQQ